MKMYKRKVVKFLLGHNFTLKFISSKLDDLYSYGFCDDLDKQIELIRESKHSLMWMTVSVFGSIISFVLSCIIAAGADNINVFKTIPLLGFFTITLFMLVFIVGIFSAVYFFELYILKILFDVFDEFQDVELKDYHEFKIRQILKNRSVVVTDSGKIFTAKDFKQESFNRLSHVSHRVVRYYDNVNERHNSISTEYYFVVPNVDNDVFNVLTKTQQDALNDLLYKMSIVCKSDKMILLRSSIVALYVDWQGTYMYDETHGYWFDGSWHLS